MKRFFCAFLLHRRNTTYVFVRHVQTELLIWTDWNSASSPRSRRSTSPDARPPSHATFAEVWFPKGGGATRVVAADRCAPSSL
jgi:hypothetical protein